jgi:hypothetical protein
MDTPSKDLLELKSGLGPGARGGRAVALGSNAEDVVVEGNDRDDFVE